MDSFEGVEDAFEDKMDPFVSRSMADSMEPAETVVAEEIQSTTSSGSLSINDLIKQQSEMGGDSPSAIPSLEPLESESAFETESDLVEEPESVEPVFNLGQGDLHQDSKDLDESMNQIENLEEEIPVSESNNVVAASGNQESHKDYSTVGRDLIRWSKSTPITGFLVSFKDNKEGDYFVLRAGRLIVSSDASAKGSLLLLDDETVSPMHAIIRIAEKNVIVLDQLSENGTSVQRADGEQLELSGDKTNLQHGDEISFGDKTFKVCLL